MTSINHSNNLCPVTLHFPSSTPPPSSAASSSSPSSTGWTDKITKKIQELKSELESLNNLKEAKNGYLPENDSKSLDSFPTQVASLETVHKLAEFADQLDTVKNPSNNILTNLCTGLETFLGFNSASKGYNGTGIVYSDLDRLCDAVMGFLSGVLEAVKNENEVTTYDKYISEKNNKLETVINTLTTSIGSGRDGLAASVAAVKGWLEGYEKSVKQKCEDVKTPLKIIKKDIINVEQKFQEQKNKSLRDQHKDWKHTLELYLGHADEAEQAQDKLDSHLKMKLETPVTAMKEAMKLLHESAKNEELTEQVQAADNELLKQEEYIHESIDDESKRVQGTIDEEFGKIWKEIRNLNGLRNMHVAQIREFITVAKNKVDKDFGDHQSNFKNQILHKFAEIKWALNDVNNEKYSSGDDGMTRLRNDFNSLRSQLGNVNSNLQDHLRSLQIWMENAKRFIDNVRQAHVDKILAEVNEPAENKTQHEKAAIQLIAKADGLYRDASKAKEQVGKLVLDTMNKIPSIEKVYQDKLVKIKKQIEEAVGADDSKGVLGHLKQVDDDVRKGLIAVRDKMLETLKQYVENQLPGDVSKVLTPLTEKIANDGVNPESLGKVITSVQSYAKLFDAQFETAVKTLVGELVKSEGLKDGSLYWYVDGNKGYGHLKSTLGSTAQAIVMAIIPIASQKITEALDKIPKTLETQLGAQASVDQSLQEIANYLKHYTNEVMQQENDIIRAIEVDVKHVPPTSSMIRAYNDTYLRKVLKSVLTAVKCMAEEAEKEVRNFISQSKITNLGAAIRRVKSLGTDLERELGNRGTPLSTLRTKSFLAKAFEDIDNKLREVINGAGDEFHRITFKEQSGADTGLMSDFMKQTRVASNSGAPAEEGALRKKIKDIIKPLNGITDRTDDGSIAAYLDKNTYTKAKHTLFGAIGEISTQVKDALESIDGLKADAEKYANQVNTSFGLLCNEISTAGNAVQSSLKKLKDDEIDIRLRLISEKIENLRMKELNIGIGNANDIIPLIRELEKIPGYIEQKEKNVKQMMKKMYDDLIYKIESIEARLNDADDALTAAIKDLHSAYDHAYGHVNKAVEDLKNNLFDITEHAFESLTKEVRTLLATKNMVDLKTMQELIERQIKHLNRIIDDDLPTGVKGFLKTLQCGSTKVTKPKNIEQLSTLASSISSSPAHNPPHLKHLAEAFHDFCQPLHTYLLEEITRANQHPSGAAHNYSSRLDAVYNAFSTLLPHLREQNKYDHRVPSMLSNLRDAVNLLKPDGFSTPNSSTLDCITSGLTRFADELDKAYISVYDGQGFEGKVVEETGAQVVYTTGAYPVYLSTEYGKKCAKVFCSALEILFHDLSELREECKRDWKDLRICMHPGEDIENGLALYLKNCGYRVPSKQGVQDGELRYGDSWTGQQIREALLTKEHNSTQTYKAFTLVYDNDEKDDEQSAPTHSVLKQLLNYLTRYYEVCHYDAATSTKYPSSIYHMLTWLSGLPHSTVYLEFTADGFEGLFEKKEEASESIDSDGPLVSHFGDVSLPAYPKDITVETLSGSLAAVCSGAHDVLTSVLGHGHSGGRYACDFNANPDKFTYPADMVTLACWLYDILRRVHHQLYFLYQQCYHNTERNGWAECYYGRYVAGSSWQCNRMQCPDQTCEQKCKQTCNQIHNQKGDQHPNCGLKSPLQSFLEDGLQGFLPHHVKFEKGKLDCSVKGHSNVPCKTPMGFGNISDIASHTQRGRHIYDALKRLCGDERSPLPKLCGQLSCLLPSAPKTLDDMLAFYYRLLRGWDNENSKRVVHRETAFRDAVKAANFEESNTVLDISTICKHNAHTLTLPDKISTHITGDLYALVDCNGMSSSVPSHPCGRYMRPICHDMCGTFTKENADKYLSWIVYCTETFLQLLKQLYEECNNNCAGERPKCRISKCKKGCKALESPMATGSAHADSCKSIVDCKFMRPTFFKYGLVLGDCKSLSAKSTKRTCKDLCMVLKSVTNEIEVDGHPLAKLVHVTIPEFLLKIRFPFMTLTLALWLLSLLYLLHIMVIRLDLLHIKSHLHSPSSHRIAAQSLLAASRVNKLNRVFYLQP